jgi:hypothetical protein
MADKTKQEQSFEIHADNHEEQENGATVSVVSADARGPV